MIAGILFNGNCVSRHFFARIPIKPLTKILIVRIRPVNAGVSEKLNRLFLGCKVSKDNPDNALVYIIAFPSRLDQESMWKAFKLGFDCLEKIRRLCAVDYAVIE